MPQFIWPVPGYPSISSGYYDPRDYGLHGAIDIPAPAVPTVAIGPGRVIFFGWAGAAGRSVYVELEGGYRAHYCHLSHFDGDPINGEIAAGDAIGLVGGSGYGTDNHYGSHLHLNLFAPMPPPTGPSHWVDWVGMWAVDPELYLGKEDDDMPTTDELQAWVDAHLQIHTVTLENRLASHGERIERNKDQLSDVRARVAALEKRPTSGGPTLAEVKALIEDAKHSV